MRSIKEADIIEGTLVLIRVDWNVPIGLKGEVLDTSRIEASQKTINYALEKGAKVVLMSHLGDGSNSLEPVVKEAEKFFPGVHLRFVRDPWNASSPTGLQNLQYLSCGGIAVLENLRFWLESENDPKFAEQLAMFGDIYVNEAFSVSHRAHTSIVGVPKLLPSFAGFHFLEEYENLSKAFNPPHPFLFILGGAKLETKLPLVNKFAQIADDVFIAGLLAKEANDTDLVQNKKIFLPLSDLDALDINKETFNLLEEKIKKAKFVLWNGPVGYYEKGHVWGTEEIAKALANSKAHVVVGGGDTVAAIKKLGNLDKFDFVSTSGGAMLDFLAKGTLPGIEALESQTTNQK